MKYLAQRVLAGWRRPAGWLASYALVFQLLIGALAGAQVSAAAAGQNWSFFEICYGKGGALGEQPDGIPAKHTSKCAACVLAAVNTAAIEPEAVVVATPAFVISEIVWVSHEENPARLHSGFSQRQRAPPIAA